MTKHATPLIQDESAFTTPGEWRRLMATLPETALISLIKDKSKAMSLPWLTTMADGGLLSIGKDLASLQTQQGLETLIDTWAERIKAATHFMTGITTEPLNSSPAYGEMDETIALAVFRAPESMKAFYAETSLALAGDFDALINHPMARNNGCIGQLHEPMAQWLGGAIVLDLPDVVAQFSRDMLEAVTGFFPMKALGGDMLSYALPDEESNKAAKKGRLDFFVTPQSLALMLSRERCLEQLWDHGATVHDTVFAKQYTNDSDVDMGVADLLSFMHPTCLPETWARMLKKGMPADGDEEGNGYDENEIETLHAMAVECMNTRTTRPWMRNYIPALIDAGIYNTNPLGSVMGACEYGSARVIASLKDTMPWDSDAFKDVMTHGVPGYISNSIQNITLFMSAAQNAIVGREAQFEQTVLQIIKMGVEAGHSDLVFSVTKHNDGSVNGVPEPVCSFAKAKFHHALVMFLENGLDPHAKNGGMPSLMQYADDHAPEAAHVIRTFEARQQALGTLREIDRMGLKP